MKVNVRPALDNVVDLRLVEILVIYLYFSNICDCSDVSRYDEELSTKELLEGSKVSEEDKEEYVKGIVDAMQVARTYTAPGASQNEDRYPEVTFLGTGSSVPSKYRNVTGILVETEPESFIILDCGEGTLGQLVRLHGVEVISDNYSCSVLT